MGVSVARVSQIGSGDVSTQDVPNRYVTAWGSYSYGEPQSSAVASIGFGT